MQNIKSTDRIRKKHTSRTWHDSDDTENYNTLFNKSNSTKKPVNIGHLPIWWLRHAHLILVGAPKSFTNKLQRVLNAAARTVTGIMIEDCHIYCILSCTGWTSWSGSCTSLLWWSTDVSRTRRRSTCQNYCVPVSEVASRQYLWSASRHQLLLIPRYRFRTFGHQAFVVADPTFWNSLADELWTYSSDRFKLALKTFLFATYTSVFSALEASAVMCYINWWLTLTVKSPWHLIDSESPSCRLKIWCVLID